MDLSEKGLACNTFHIAVECPPYSTCVNLFLFLLNRNVSSEKMCQAMSSVLSLQILLSSFAYSTPAALFFVDISDLINLLCFFRGLPALAKWIVVNTWIYFILFSVDNWQHEQQGSSLLLPLPSFLLWFNPAEIPAPHRCSLMPHSTLPIK